MKKLLIATAIVLSFALARFAQGQSAEEKAAARQRYLDATMIVLEEDSARITTTTDRTDYGGGQNIILRIDLKNVGTKYFGNSNIVLESEKVYNFYDIDITNQIGEKVPRLKIHEVPNMGNGIEGWGLKPGKTQKAVVWLNNLFDFTYGGKFKVTVSKTFRKDGKLTTISSEPVEFKIVTKKSIAEWWGNPVDEN